MLNFLKVTWNYKERPVYLIIFPSVFGPFGVVNLFIYFLFIKLNLLLSRYVGAMGLAVNLIGLCLFHEHGSSHGHSHGLSRSVSVFYKISFMHLHSTILRNVKVLKLLRVYSKIKLINLGNKLFLTRTASIFGNKILNWNCLYIILLVFIYILINKFVVIMSKNEIVNWREK